MARKIEPGEKPASRPAKAAAPAQAAKPTQVATAQRGSIPYRIGAIVCWVLALVCEGLAIMALMNYFYPPFNKTAFLILAIVLDLGFAIAGAQLWKKANHIKPFSEKNKFLFYLASELGVIMGCICFIPLIVLLIKDKSLDKKSKIIVTIVAIVALLITGVASADFNPISAEQKEEAESTITGEVYWTTFGHKYHLSLDCPHIRNSTNQYAGEVKEAIETGRTAICSYCAGHYAEELGLDLEALNVESGGAEAAQTPEATEAPATEAPAA